MRYTKYIPVILCCGLLHSCNLDLIPENAITYTNAFATEKELNTTTSSIHFYLFQTMENFFTLQQVGEVCDERPWGMDVRNWSPKAVFGSTPSWKGFYDVIFESNLLLENIGSTKGLSEDRKNYHMGQAYFAKGFAYLNIAQRYGDAIVTTGATNVQPYGISPMLDVIDEAIKAGEEAYKVLPVFEELKLLGGGTPTNKQYASKGAAAALLAHAYAWKGSMIELYSLEGDAKECYRNAIKYAGAIIDGTAGSYSLKPSIKELCSSLSNLTDISPEDIWIIGFDINRSIWSASPSMARSFVSYPVDKTRKLGDLTSSTDMLIYQSTIKEMYPDPEDERLKEFFYEINEKHAPDNTGKNYALMNKYREGLFNKDEYAPSGESFRTIKAHYNYWRLAGIYLLRAECYAKLGEDAKGIEDLNTIRRRAKATEYPAPYDTKGLRYAVFKERERELLYESDHRYFDVMRNGYYRTELQGVFATLSKTDVKDGALFLPVPSTAYGTAGRNTLVRQKTYWAKFM